jgi:hypothetical protein
VSAALFARPPRRRGSTERAIEAVIHDWREAGTVIDQALSSQLRGAAHDVDRARDEWLAGEGSGFTVTRARALLRELYRDARPDLPTVDAVDEALISLLADADAAAS